MKTLEGDFSPSHIQDVVAANFCDIEMTVQATRNSCRTCFDSIRLGQIEALRYRSEGMQKGTRRWEHIRKDQADMVSLYVPISMSFHIATANKEVWLSPGHFCFISTRQPFSLVQEHSDGKDFYSSIYIKIPGALIRQRLLCIDDLCFKVFPIEPGCSAIMRKIVDSIFEDGPFLSESASAKFGQTVLDAVVSAAEHAAKESSAAVSSLYLNKQQLVARAKSFIEQNLSNTDVNIATIADHCHVSVRYLHAAFASCDQTVAGYLRDRRLELSRSALCDPLLRGRSIMRIAQDWGFSDASQFGRLYKRRFGHTPREERNACYCEPVNAKPAGFPERTASTPVDQSIEY